MSFPNVPLGSLVKIVPAMRSLFRSLLVKTRVFLDEPALDMHGGENQAIFIRPHRLGESDHVTESIGGLYSHSETGEANDTCALFM